MPRIILNLWRSGEGGVDDDKREINKNLLEITVYGHRRNAFGPFYLNESSPHWVGPLQFKTCQQKEKQLVPCGLME